jgi:hypothetical protein
VRDVLGPLHRSYRLPGKESEVWEYQLEGFKRPLTLHAQLSSDQIVREVFTSAARRAHWGELLAFLLRDFT